MSDVEKTAAGPSTKDERRRELEQIRSEFGGSRRIADIFGGDPQPGDYENIPGSFINAMIDRILRREFPDES